MNDTMTRSRDLASGMMEDEDVLRIGQTMSRMRLMMGRRVIGRMALENVAPELELSHLDVLEVVRRAGEAGEVTVGTIAASMRIDPSRASRIVAEMVGRGVLRREASQADARRIVVVPTELGGRLLAEIRSVKLSFIESIVADWPGCDRAEFGRLFERFIDGFELMYRTREKGDAP